MKINHYKPHIITGFIIHGWLFFIPGIVKLPNPDIKKWGGVEIPHAQLKVCYIGLEIKSILKNVLKSLKIFRLFKLFKR